MTIIYNKNTPDYYLVAGLEEGSHRRSHGQKTRTFDGNIIVISSDNKTNAPALPEFLKPWKAVRKTLLILLLISMMPFTTVLATGYLHLMITGDVS